MYKSYSKKTAGFLALFTLLSLVISIRDVAAADGFSDVDPEMYNRSDNLDDSNDGFSFPDGGYPSAPGNQKKNSNFYNNPNSNLDNDKKNKNKNKNKNKKTKKDREDDVVIDGQIRSGNKVKKQSKRDFNKLTDKWVFDNDMKNRTIHVVPHGLDLHLANKGERAYMLAPDGKQYQMFNMLRKTLSFSTRINVPCGHNLAVYFSQFNYTNKPAFGYNHAQKVPGGNEVDVIELNQVACQVASHSCRQDGHCDPIGLKQRVFWNATQAPFDIKKEVKIETTFLEDRIIQTFRQKGKVFHRHVVTEANGNTTFGSWPAVNKAWESGMGLVISIWNTDKPDGMSWLDGGCKKFIPPSKIKVIGKIRNLKITNAIES